MSRPRRWTASSRSAMADVPSSESGKAPLRNAFAASMSVSEISPLANRHDRHDSASERDRQDERGAHSSLLVRHQYTRHGRLISEDSLGFDADVSNSDGP